MSLHTLTSALLAHLAENKFVILDALFPPGYGETRLTRHLLGLDDFRYRASSRRMGRRSVANILSRLEKQGLVARKKSSTASHWMITVNGKRHIDTLCGNGEIDKLPPSDGIIRVVTFDIPEQERAKRDWLRSILVSCGYTTLQKSVYTATRPLPNDIFREIEARGVSKYMHIMSIGKKGTLVNAV